MILKEKKQMKKGKKRNATARNSLQIRTSVIEFNHSRELRKLCAVEYSYTNCKGNVKEKKRLFDSFVADEREKHGFEL